MDTADGPVVVGHPGRKQPAQSSSYFCSLRHRLLYTALHHEWTGFCEGAPTDFSVTLVAVPRRRPSSAISFFSFLSFFLAAKRRKRELRTSSVNHRSYLYKYGWTHVRVQVSKRYSLDSRRGEYERLRTHTHFLFYRQSAISGI